MTDPFLQIKLKDGLMNHANIARYTYIYMYVCVFCDSASQTMVFANISLSTQFLRKVIVFYAELLLFKMNALLIISALENVVYFLKLQLQ
jgi:hypothetical protein